MTGTRASRVPACDSSDVVSDARALIDDLGPMASTHAARKALELVAAGDHAGYRHWLQILNAVDTLLDRGADATSA